MTRNTCWHFLSLIKQNTDKVTQFKYSQWQRTQKRSINQHDSSTVRQHNSTLWLVFLFLLLALFSLNTLLQWVAKIHHLVALLWPQCGGCKGPNKCFYRRQHHCLPVFLFSLVSFTADLILFETVCLGSLSLSLYSLLSLLAACVLYHTRANNWARRSFLDCWCRVVVADSAQSTPTPVNKQIFVVKKSRVSGVCVCGRHVSKLGDIQTQHNTHTGIWARIHAPRALIGFHHEPIASLYQPNKIKLYVMDDKYITWIIIFVV